MRSPRHAAAQCRRRIIGCGCYRVRLLAAVFRTRTGARQEHARPCVGQPGSAEGIRSKSGTANRPVTRSRYVPTDRAKIARRDDCPMILNDYRHVEAATTRGGAVKSLPLYGYDIFKPARDLNDAQRS